MSILALAVVIAKLAYSSQYARHNKALDKVHGVIEWVGQ